MNEKLPICSTRLENEKKSLDLSITELSGNASIPYTTIRNYEKGYRKISQKNAEKLAKYFKVSIPYIMGIDEVKGNMISISISEYERLQKLEERLKKAEEKLNSIKQILK